MMGTMRSTLSPDLQRSCKIEGVQQAASATSKAKRPLLEPRHLRALAQLSCSRLLAVAFGPSAVPSRPSIPQMLAPARSTLQTSTAHSRPSTA